MYRFLQVYKTAYAGLSPATWWLSLVMLVNRSGTMVVPFMTLYLTRSMGFSVTQAGFVMGFFGAGAICGGFIGGKLADKFGFYYVQICTLIGGGIMFIILGQMRSFELICVFSFLLSLVNDSFRPANSSAIAHYSKEDNRTRSFSLNRLAINLGWSAGGALGGFIAARNYELLFWIDGFTNIGAAFLLWVFLAPSKNKATQKKPQIVSDVPVRSAYKDKPYLIFFVLMVLFSFCFFQLFTTLPVYYRNNLRMNEMAIGSVMAMNGILIALMEMLIIHSLEGRRHILQYISLGTLIIGFSFVMFNIFPGAVMLAVASTIFMTIGEILSMPFMNTYWISRSTDSNRGQYAGLYSMAWSSAQVLGPVSGSLIADHFGFNILWCAIGFICLLTAAGFYWLQGKS